MRNCIACSVVVFAATWALVVVKFFFLDRNDVVSKKTA